MSNLRKFINSDTLIKDEIYKNYEYSLCCAICSDILIESTICMYCQTLFCKTVLMIGLKRVIHAQIDVKILNLKKAYYKKKFYQN